MQNKARAQRVIDFIEKLIVPSGEGAGKSFKLEKFQKDFIKDIYTPAYKKKGNLLRCVRRAILSLARKNGKSTLITGLVLAHLVGPEAELNGEIYSAATTKKQAGIIFKYAKQIVDADLELSSYIKIVDSTKTMVCYSNGSVYKVLCAEAGQQYGENPTLIIYDELAQAKNMNLYNALDSSMGARAEPLFVVISTQSNDPQHILSILIDDGLSGLDPTTVCRLHSVPDNAENVLEDEKLWKLANPALDIFRSLEDIRAQAQRAKRMPSFEASFRNLYLNQRVDTKSVFIPRAEWEGCKGTTEIPIGSDIYLALDLSGKIDLSALVGVSDGEYSKVKSWFWKPKDSLKEHEDRDRVPYSLWENQGFIKTTPGRAIQYSFIAQELAEINKNYNILGIAFDRYRIDDLMNAMDEIGLDCYVEGKDKQVIGIRLVPWGQGYVSMTGAVEALEISIVDRLLIHDGHPCLTWNISNTITISDAAGNRKIDKSQTRFRIDGAVALAMAVGLKSKDRAVEKTSPYDGKTQEEIKKMLTGEV
jgi:phage terminase large subunit-like protein